MCNTPRYRPHRLGQQAEKIAKQFLLAQGLSLLESNFHCRRGEIDLIMLEGDSLVFVEVRYRNRQDYGGALESVDRRKQQRIIHCAEFFLMQRPQERNRSMRFDVVCVAQQKTCEWIRHAFEAY